ncbi:mat a-1 [Podospora fimiseda]|uniref:Mat a-1 n=1 Tax=Podospora fimiseda TaxID=252190 RepID=A0AAN7BZ43_9PEZI|nr:mat a-1 [Podospora fimiseda]
MAAFNNVETDSIPESWKRLCLPYDANAFQGDFKRLSSLGEDTDPGFTKFLTNKYWNHLAIQLGHWNPMKVIVMDHEMFNFMPDHTKAGVLRAMQHFLNEDAMFVRDPNNCQFLILGPRKILEPEITMVGNTPIWDPKKKHVGIEAPAKLSRPANAYILYRKDHHEAVKAANPGMHNNDISVITGAMWKAESEEVRQKYIELAEEVKTEFMKNNPDYRYTPRRSCDIKRRLPSSNKKGTAAARVQARAGPISGAHGFVNNEAGTRGIVRSQITDLIPGSRKFLGGDNNMQNWSPFDYMPVTSNMGFENSFEANNMDTTASATSPIALSFPVGMGNGADPATPATPEDTWMSFGELDDAINGVWDATMSI